MAWSEDVTQTIETLLTFAERKALIDPLDRPYCRNLLLDVMGMQAPAENVRAEEHIPETATQLLKRLCDAAVEKELIEDLTSSRDLFSARLMGCVTPAPAQVRARFQELVAAGKPEEATREFYEMCRACDYIKVDAIAQNIRYFADSPCGELEITINLSKPEKDPREIAKLKNAPSVGYPKCMLCIENPGYAGRSNFPARQNHRIVPLTLAGDPWFIQYSPYLYYPEHCIVFNSQHVPMKISRGTFERLFSFVDQFPHYFLGSNADLPIVGGSILNHDHFQGGHYMFPMDKASIRCKLTSPDPEVDAAILDWPMSAVALTGTSPEHLIDAADKLLTAWRGYSDPTCGIYAETEGQPHNTITPILRKADGKYRLLLVLRNNRTSAEHPLGIFHPHEPLHHIKKENIGLIEVMGLAVLPARLANELTLLEQAMLRGDDLTADPVLAPHAAWAAEVRSRHPEFSLESAGEILRQEVGAVFAQVLEDAGVFKRTPDGQAAFRRWIDQIRQA